MPAADPFDELAALFLTQPDAEPAPHTGRTSIEVVVCGNLPVMGSLWMAQYAEACARREGPTALLRLDGDAPRIEIFHPLDREEAQPPDVARWIRTQSVAHWIVKPANDTPLSDVAHLGADEVSVMTGADEAAIVAAYRLVKEIIESSPAEGNPPLPKLVILGSEPGRARDVSEKLRRTIATFLGVTLPASDTIQKMDAVESIGPWPIHLDGSLQTVINEIDAIRQASSSAGPSLSRLEPPLIDVIRRDGRVSLPPKPAQRRPTPESSPAPAASPACDPPLTSYLADLRPIQFRSPSAPGIELAVDGSGVLHLLATDVNLVAALRAKSWALAHRDILSKADLSLALSNEPVIHLFADSPARLVEMQGLPWRLHLLARVNVDGRAGWYHAPLDAPAAS